MCFSLLFGPHENHVMGRIEVLDVFLVFGRGEEKGRPWRVRKSRAEEGGEGVWFGSLKLELCKGLDDEAGPGRGQEV